MVDVLLDLKGNVWMNVVVCGDVNYERIDTLATIQDLTLVLSAAIQIP